MDASFLEHFSRLEDPRIERCKRHGLLDILFWVFYKVSG